MTQRRAPCTAVVGVDLLSLLYLPGYDFELVLVRSTGVPGVEQQYYVLLYSPETSWNETYLQPDIPG